MSSVVSNAEPETPATLEMFVKSIRHEAHGVHSYDLRPLAGGALPWFDAGAHIDLHLPNGLLRSYSLINPSDEPTRYVIAVNNDRSSRGGSRFIHDQLKPGDRLRSSAPRNDFALAEDARHSVLIAGGIGVTPIWAMIQRLAVLGRPWELHYACRTRDCAAFLDPIAELARRSAAPVTVTFDQEPGASMLDLGQIVTRAPADAHLYCCGPTGMIEAFRRAVAGRPEHLVRIEYFTPPVIAPVDGPFTVTLARTGVSVEVEEGCTILEALLQNGIKVNYSCTQGICGTCETTVLEGVPEHRDWVLSAEKKAANRTMMICCSGSKTARLVLDL